MKRVKIHEKSASLKNKFNIWLLQLKINMYLRRNENKTAYREIVNVLVRSGGMTRAVAKIKVSCWFADSKRCPKIISDNQNLYIALLN